MGAIITGKPRSFYKKFKFIVEIDGLNYAGFQTCSELSVEVAKVEQWEGGKLIPDKSPGRLTFSDITLERGATDDKDLFDWMKLTADAAANAGLVDFRYKKNADIVQQDRDGGTLVRWRCKNAWMTKFIAGDWDNGADDNVVESATLTYDYFERVKR